jgi:hypothetical protein
VRSLIFDSVNCSETCGITMLTFAFAFRYEAAIKVLDWEESGNHSNV